MNLTYDSQMFRETFESEFTWLNGFMRNVRRFSDKPAAIDSQSGRIWSYKELNADANRFANAVRDVTTTVSLPLISLTTTVSLFLVTVVNVVLALKRIMSMYQTFTNININEFLDIKH